MHSLRIPASSAAKCGRSSPSVVNHKKFTFFLRKSFRFCRCRTPAWSAAPGTKFSVHVRDGIGYRRRCNSRRVHGKGQKMPFRMNDGDGAIARDKKAKGKQFQARAKFVHIFTARQVRRRRRRARCGKVADGIACAAQRQRRRRRQTSASNTKDKHSHTGCI